MLVAFSVTPLGVGEGVGEIVAEAVRVVRASGLPNQTDAMFTTVEGDWDEVMAVVKEAVDAVAVQLAAYRLAWAALADVPLDRVRAAFYYVRDDLTVRPADLLDEAGLVERIDRVPTEG